MKNIFFLLTLFIFFSCEEIVIDDALDTYDQSILSQLEENKLCEMGINPLTAIPIKDYIVISDIAINRNDLTNSVARRHVTTGISFMPFAKDANKITIYLHPSLTQDWRKAIIAATSCISDLPHKQITFEFKEYTRWGHGINIFMDNILDDQLPLCFKNVGLSTVAIAEFPFNQRVGRYISINDVTPNNYTLHQKTAIVAHELTHNLGYRHACSGLGTPGNVSNTVSQVGCTEVYSQASHIVTTYIDEDNPDECDSTSLMYVTTMFFPLYSDPIPIISSNMSGCTFFNADDIFSYQAQYPISYEPFSFDIESCNIIIPNGISDGKHFDVAEFHVNYHENDFVPYKIIATLRDVNSVEITTDTLYRYWPNKFQFPLDVNSYQADCLYLSIRLENFKGDIYYENTSTDCCVLY